MGGPSGPATSTTQSGNTLPTRFNPEFNTSASEWLAAEQGLPNIEGLYSGMPLEGVPNLTPEQQGVIGGIEAYPAGLNAPEAGAVNQLDYLTNVTGPNGTTAATNAAEDQFSQQSLPQIQQQAALMGQGDSGAALAAEAQGQASALTPLLQTQEQVQSAGVNQGAALGGQQYSQDQATLAAQLQAAGMSYDVAQQQAQALFNQQQSQSSLAQEVQTAPFTEIPSIYGRGTSISTSNPGGGGSSKF